MRCIARVSTTCPDKWHSLIFRSFHLICYGFHSPGSLIDFMGIEVSYSLIKSSLCVDHLSLFYSFFMSLIESFEFPCILESPWSSDRFHDSGSIGILSPFSVDNLRKSMHELLFAWFILMIFYRTHFSDSFCICFFSP